MTQAQCETELRKHTTKVRAGMRGLVDLMRKRFDSEVPEFPSEFIDAYETLIMAQFEFGIDQMTQALREG